MKLHFVTAASAVLLAAIAALGAQAAPATHISIGQSAAADCARAADAQSRDRLLASALHDALQSCDQALDGTLPAKDRTATLTNRGTLEVADERTDAALADFNAALARDPNLANVYLDRGAALLEAARFDEARADFDRAIALHVSNAAVAYFDRGMVSEKTGDLKAAYRDYQQAQALAPDFEPAKAELARFRFDNNSNTATR